MVSDDVLKFFQPEDDLPEGAFTLREIYERDDTPGRTVVRETIKKGLAAGTIKRVGNKTVLDSVGRRQLVPAYVVVQKGR